MPQYLIFTDLDGCLLDSQSYSFDAARPALQEIQARNIPLVLVSSKTRAELEPLREQLNHHDPFIVENGGAIVVPLGTFDFPLDRARRRGDYQMIEFGTPYAMLRDVLKQIEEAVCTPLKGFGDLSIDELRRATGLTREAAIRAKLREYDEPYLVAGPPSIAEEVGRQIMLRGLRWTKGGRFFHLTGSHDKGLAVSRLLECYRERWHRENRLDHIVTIGIGDNMNDLPLLLAVDHPVLVQKGDGSYDPGISLPRLIRAPGVGPVGWNAAVLQLLAHTGQEAGTRTGSGRFLA
ncbi:MAG TPA: HAD-IIB family hydrolase [Nitrospira sp.]|nr:HAD-IIB family hydrolase [Nitrospira sp.]